MVKLRSFTIIYFAFFFVKRSPIILISSFFIYIQAQQIYAIHTGHILQVMNQTNECSQTELTCYINDTGMQYVHK